MLNNGCIYKVGTRDKVPSDQAIPEEEVRNMLLPKVFMDDFFNDDFMPRVRDASRSNEWLKTDIIEKEDKYELAVNLPGFQKENVKISLDEGYLTINASTNNEKKDEEEGKVIRRERFQGSCQRSFYVGDQVTKEDISAKFDNGVLHLTVPKVTKKEVPSEQFIEIE